MAESKPEQEPSIEEILASIRQIISDDDEGAAPQADKAPAAPPPVEAAEEPVEPVTAEQPEATPADPVAAEPDVPEVETAKEAESEEDVLELTTDMQEEPLEQDVEDDALLDDDIEIALAEINETLAQEPVDDDLNDDDGGEPEPSFDEDVEEDMALGEESFEDIISEKAQSAALASMSKLASGMPVSKPKETPRHYDGVTLEDIVRDLLHPMLREWMDDNLPPMVERIVQKELEKLSRRIAD
jgi:hypothetical protein